MTERCAADRVQLDHMPPRVRLVYMQTRARGGALRHSRKQLRRRGRRQLLHRGASCRVRQLRPGARCARGNTARQQRVRTGVGPLSRPRQRRSRAHGATSWLVAARAPPLSGSGFSAACAATSGVHAMMDVSTRLAKDWKGAWGVRTLSKSAGRFRRCTSPPARMQPGRTTGLYAARPALSSPHATPSTAQRAAQVSGCAYNKTKDEKITTTRHQRGDLPSR
jgi:hypothetical protein